MLASFPDCRAVNLGGGIPHSYRDPSWQPDLRHLGRILVESRARFCEVGGRAIRVEIEPGRFFVAPAATLVARVADVTGIRAALARQAEVVGPTFLLVETAPESGPPAPRIPFTPGEMTARMRRAVAVLGASGGPPG